MKTVLILTPFYNPFVGGAEVAVEEISNRLKSKIKVVIFTSLISKKLTKKSNDNGIFIYRLGFGNRYDKYLFPFFALHKSFYVEFDSLYAVMASYAGLAAFLIKIIRKKPYILNLQGELLNNQGKKSKFRIINFLFRAIYTNADKIIAISGFLKKQAEAFSVKSSKIVVIPNGVNLLQFKPIKNKNDNFIRLITVARLEPIKGVYFLIKAMPKILEGFCNTILIIAGDGSQRKDLEMVVKDLSLTKSVFFVGLVKREQLPYLLNSCDLLVCPSISEGLSISCIEAMACGLPIIATNVGGIPDIIKHKENGLLVNPADSNNLAKEVIYLLENRNVMQKMSRNSLMVVGKYDWEIISKQIYENLFYNNNFSS